MKSIFLQIKKNASLAKLFDFVKKNQNTTILILLMLLAVVIRFWDLPSLPGGISATENELIGRIQAMNRDNIWLGGEYYQGAYLYLSFLWTKVFGLTVLSLRILSVIIGSLTVYACYSFIAKWFSKKIAIFLAFLFAISSFHISVSRLILPEILMPLMVLALFNSLTVAYRTKNVWYFALSGVILGLGLYTSPAFLLVPLLLVLAGSYFYTRNKKFITAYREELIIALVAFVSVSIPYIVSFATHPDSYAAFYGFNNSIGQVALNIGAGLQMMFFYTPADYFINLGSEPLFDPFIFVTSLSGFLYALFRMERRKYFFLVFWFILILLYGALKSQVSVSNLIGVIPIVYIFSALILNYVAKRWFETFPYNKFARIFLIGLISIFFTLSAIYNINRYFVAYRESKMVEREFSVTPQIPLK